MVHKPSGGATSFENMSHEQMLQWLDQANSGSVQAAADRLTAAAKAIRDIAEDLKIRPQYVEWKGEGASAFRTWSGDLANATLRLGDYSEDASKWLARASDAIAEAQATIPRDTRGSEANLAAAQAHHNDPDAAAITAKSLQELAATKEANRQEAAARMRKLGQSYQFSAQQMAGLERPAFPPPPADVMPSERSVINGRDLARPGESAGGVPSAGGPAPDRSTSEAPGVAAPASGGAAAGPTPSEVPARTLPPVGMEVNSTAPPLQQPSAQPSVPGPAPTASPRPEGATPPVIGTTPPLSPTRNTPSAGPGVQQGRPSVAPRPPAIPGPGTTGGTAAGRPPANNGIIGGRPTPPAAGRPTGAFPRGPVIGSEPTPGRVPTAMGHGAGTAGGSTGQGRSVPAGRYAREAGGVVGGTPQQGRASGARFTAGGSGLVRGPSASGTSAQSAAPMGRGAAGVPASGRLQQRRQDDESREQPDHLSEDEETWLPDNRRTVPPVIE
ncbi:translation initiation factor IF-2 [Streptomyces sp. KLOTTS4A1]|uniref:translation initiation factor IF-2 n=1 Tax=Streptomyces sp. KLOTTS4A1 TaxID=3390996 RepID=UPI0039F4702B